MKYLKLFKIFEFVKFEHGRMSDWRNWASNEKEIEEVESLFPESLFRDIEDILSSLSDSMATNVTYDVIQDNTIRGKDKLLVIRILFEKKGSLEVSTKELASTFYHLREYMRENNYMNNKMTISLSDGEHHKANGGDIDYLLDNVVDEIDVKVNRATIEFLTRV